MIPLNAETDFPDVDLRAGEQYWIRHKHDTVAATFSHADGNGVFIFEVVVDQTKHGRGTVNCDRATWKRMRSDGRANRIPKAFVNERNLIELGDFDPTNLLDPEEPKITHKEHKERLRKWKIYERRRALRFYVMKADEAGVISHGHVGVSRFMQGFRAEALRQGHDHMPSPGTLLRAIMNCGCHNSRPMSAFYHDFAAYNKLKAWHPLVVKHCDKWIDSYWSDRKLLLTDVRSSAFDAINQEIAALREKSITVPPNLKVPSSETFRTWLGLTEDWYRWKDRYGEDSANARYRGHGVSVKATRPGEYVLFDHTIIDEWAVIEDENGDIILTERPTLTIAVDLYSHMVLGAVLSYEKPSLWSVMACLKEVVRYKHELVARFTEAKGATDGYIKPFAVIVDNGWEFWGVSFQAMLEAQGINVIWAPVRTPQFKAVVERLFNTLNEKIWHRMEGGLPFTPQVRSKLRLNPQTEAYYTLPDLQVRLWSFIVGQLHLNVNDELGAAPAQLWVEGIKRKGRPMVDNMNAFDGMLGQTTRALLHSEGIEVWGQRFHDPAITTELLLRILPASSRVRKSGDRLGANSVEVNVSRDPMDVSRLSVWDPILKTHVQLPHVRIRVPISWTSLETIEEFAKRKNLAFHSEEEQLRARAEYVSIVRGLVEVEPFRDARKHAKVLEPAPELMPGDRVEQVYVTPAHDGAVDIPHDSAIKHRTDDLVSEIGPSKSKKARKAASKKRSSRKPNTAVDTSAQLAPAPPPVPKFTAVPSDQITDVAGFLAALKAKEAARA